MRTLLSAPVIIGLLLLAGLAMGFHWPQMPHWVQTMRAFHVDLSSRVAPAAHHYAPEGTFYMARYASVRTPRGVYGFEPGSEVYLVPASTDQGMIGVSDGQQSILVRPSMLTNDIEEAAQMRNDDRALQAAIASYLERQRADYETSHRDIYIAHAESVHAAELERIKGAAIGRVATALDQPAQPTQTTAPDGTDSSNPANTANPANAFPDEDYDKLVQMMHAGK